MALGLLTIAGTLLWNREDLVNWTSNKMTDLDEKGVVSTVKETYNGASQEINGMAEAATELRQKIKDRGFFGTAADAAMESAKEAFTPAAGGAKGASDLDISAMFVEYALPAISAMLTKGSGGGWISSILVGTVVLSIMNSSLGDGLKDMISGPFNDITNTIGNSDIASNVADSILNAVNTPKLSSSSAYSPSM